MGYTEILELVKQLPPNEIEKLKLELSHLLSNNVKDADDEEFEQMILNGPVMSDEQYEAYLEGRKHLNTWTEK